MNEPPRRISNGVGSYPRLRRSLSHAQARGQVYRLGWLGQSDLKTGDVGEDSRCPDRQLRSHGWIEGRNSSSNGDYAGGKKRRIAHVAAEFRS